MDGGHEHRRALGGERVARARVRQLGDGADVAGGDLREGLLLLAAHGEQAVQALVRMGARVGELRVGPHGAREHLEERDLAHIGVGDRLEHESQRLPVRVARDLGLTVAGLHLDRWAPLSRGADLADELSEPVDADELGRRAAHDREDRGLVDAESQRVLQLLG